MSAFQKTPEERPAENSEPVFKVILHIDPKANDWNRAAIEFAEQNQKIPSRRQKVVHALKSVPRDKSASLNMSTNELNDLALKLRDKRCEGSDS